jgi:serine/threonine-protein kinase
VADDEAPTVAEGSRRDDAAASGTGTSPTPQRTGGSHALGSSDRASVPSSALELPKPETVLRKAAFEQTRRTASSGLLFNVLGLVVAPFIGGDELALRVFYAAMGAGILNNGWLLYACRREELYRQRHAVLYFSLAPFANAGVLYYLGTFGPVLVMFVLNVYTACLAYNRRVALLTLAGSVTPFALLGLAMASGAIRDPGLITTTSAVGPVGSFILVGSFTLFLILTYEQARRSRDGMVASLVERDRAVRLASHRDALVLEARQDLERALRAGGLGRFSDRVLGSFKLGKVLGRGGMGEVYDAVHVETGEPAAVKMLLPEALCRPDYVLRFFREVRIAASVGSQHVVRVLEVGDESAPMPYLAMERLSGEDLAQVLRREERLPAEAVVDLVEQVGRGLSAAAAAGIVHRDLKPQNLFRVDTDPPSWKILDFGVSKLVNAREGMTRGEAVGTPRYMAPEQAKGEAVDHRSDLYSLAVIAYRALTGHPPFKGEDVPVLVEVITRMPARPSRVSDLHAHVDAFFAIALAKSPDDRFQTADELAAALGRAVVGRLGRRSRERAAELVGAHPWGDQP